MNTILTPEEKEVVNKAIELISDPEKWTSGAFAKDETGVLVHPTDASACKWCAWGALMKFDEFDEKLSDRIFTKFSEKYNSSLEEFNDEKGREAVIEKLSMLASFASSTGSTGG